MCAEPFGHNCRDEMEMRDIPVLCMCWLAMSAPIPTHHRETAQRIAVQLTRKARIFCSFTESSADLVAEVSRICVLCSQNPYLISAERDKNLRNIYIKVSDRRVMPSSFGKNYWIHRCVGCLAACAIASSYVLLNRKVCQTPIVSQEDMKWLSTRLTTLADYKHFATHYYDWLQIYHCITFGWCIVVIILAVINIVPS
ncbi:unnamed protein product, partial [Oppiella nova]